MAKTVPVTLSVFSTYTQGSKRGRIVPNSGVTLNLVRHINDDGSPIETVGDIITKVKKWFNESHHRIFIRTAIETEWERSKRRQSMGLEVVSNTVEVAREVA